MPGCHTPALGVFAPARGCTDFRRQYLRTVTDQSGGVLPGVDISLASVSIGGPPRTTVTDSQGQFRFLNLDAGTYKVSTN